ncbi:DUF1315 family protein [Vibrio sp. JC009]|uniref:YeaC family protein n=1 Tax=Vibrio sp. JC009 TaxID=2912314 RepID=UPI0023B0A5BC|nr:DUF1315 family protein [Vibrio sp. JC009]WED20944.1 DUF1315 family protein [Vibrio sp. JC009]
MRDQQTTEEIISAITPEAYKRLQYAVETGRWPEGEQLTRDQRDYCMQAVMLYQSRHNTEPEHMSIAAGGEMKVKTKAEFKRELSGNQQEILRNKVK